MRKNNFQDMTVHEQIEAICEKLCNEYCKYPAMYHEKFLRDEYKNDDEAMEAMGDEICANCPLMKM